MNSLMLEPKYRDMDPQTEDLISRGALLDNGMVVLIENPSWRRDLRSLEQGPAEAKEAALYEAKVSNRWCEVSELSCRRGIVAFVAIYSDGTKRKRTYSADSAWYVKKDSIPKVDEPEPTEAFFVEAAETENADNTEGSDDLISYAEGDAEATMSMWGGVTEVKEETTLKQAKSFIEFHGRIEDIQSPDGPLARALRQQ